MIALQKIKENRDKILTIANKHGARNVRIIGSYARGEAGPASDLDLLVNMEDGRSLMDHAALIIDLESLLDIKVEVASERGIGERYRKKVFQEAIPL